MRHLDELPASAPALPLLVIGNDGSSKMLRLTRVYSLKPLHGINPSVASGIEAEGVGKAVAVASMRT